MNRGRVAAIDIGTNTVLLTVAERRPLGGDPTEQGDSVDSLLVIEERHAITRLGQGVDQHRKLAPEAMRRTLECLESYRREIDRLGAERVLCVGTSALRDAGGGEHFVREASRVLGTAVEVVSGPREAELTFRGALSSLGDVAADGGTGASPALATDGLEGLVLAFDVGGGSTEIVLGTHSGEVTRAVSVDVGSVRLFERHGQGDLDHARDAVRAALPAVFPGHPAVVVGIAGTMTTLWSLKYGLPFDESLAKTRLLTSDSIATFAEELHAMPVASRRSLLGIDEGRADVIPFGALVAAEVLGWQGASEVRVTGRGVRYGLLLEALH